MATILGEILSFKDRRQEAHREARKPVWCYRDPEAWQEDAGQADKESAIRNLCEVEEGFSGATAIMLLQQQQQQ
ncbi:unnamed protein product [Sphagnum troendelagicum]|uniref:Uncharacterized protein n=1 Tax=Sphagnum troendelagicum TaxID=128251 RepID=A0ABP0TEB5_9BRYO